jgi:hypothetical protein
MFARHPKSAGPARAAVPRAHSKNSGVQSAVEALLIRMRQRHYAETMPVLASYWLRTVWAAGHDSRWWRDLNDLLTSTVGDETLSGLSREALKDIQSWVQQTVLVTGHTGPSRKPQPSPAETTLDFDCLPAYASRLLNEWVPAEVAHLLLNEDEAIQPGNGIPVLAIARAIENLLVRARLSQETLEMLLSPELLSPRYVYPAHAEMLRDVALSLLGRTEAPPYPVMPATLLRLAHHSPLAADYRAAVPKASLVTRLNGEEIHVPIRFAQAAAIMNGKEVHIGSVIVTMDGRWWESRSLQTGQDHLVVHFPVGRLRIDFSADHAKLVIPCGETRRHWLGEVAFPETVEIFGREWRVSGWEQDGEQAWAHLSFSRNLSVDKIAPAGAAGLRRLRPASVDIAWSALENALTASLTQKSQDPIERLYHSELIPLGRAISGLMESVLRRRWHKGEPVEKQLRSVRYFAAHLSADYGSVPWRIVPSPVRAALLHYFPEELAEVFDGLPGVALGSKPAAISRAAPPSKAA